MDNSLVEAAKLSFVAQAQDVLPYTFEVSPVKAVVTPAKNESTTLTKKKKGNQFKHSHGKQEKRHKKRQQKTRKTSTPSSDIHDIQSVFNLIEQCKLASNDFKKSNFTMTCDAEETEKNDAKSFIFSQNDESKQLDFMMIENMEYIC